MWWSTLADTSRRTINAIHPVLEEWVRRQHGRLSYRATQILTGHGCFGDYLFRIGREQSATCWHCREGIEDSAQHTLEVCQAWVAEREILVEQVGQDLSLRAILPRMLESPDAWHAVLHFCEEVMSQKEAAEREREASPDAPPNRRRRPGHRRRHYHLHAPS
ncbi:uncharacterized protein LOC135080231 [Ostrinia nubilalis]|uniref:uncharacterized protein LOC135080231 n=1 Tax=Ostrinia nubilalis TaxID=29057 RepID=UPI0030822D54